MPRLPSTSYASYPRCRILPPISMFSNSSSSLSDSWHLAIKCEFFGTGIPLTVMSSRSMTDTLCPFLILLSLANMHLNGCDSPVKVSDSSSSSELIPLEVKSSSRVDMDEDCRVTVTLAGSSVTWSVVVTSVSGVCSPGLSSVILSASSMASSCLRL